MKVILDTKSGIIKSELFDEGLQVHGFIGFYEKYDDFFHRILPHQPLKMWKHLGMTDKIDPKLKFGKRAAWADFPWWIKPDKGIYMSTLPNDYLKPGIFEFDIQL